MLVCTHQWKLQKDSSLKLWRPFLSLAIWFPAQFPQKVKFKNVNGPETEGFGLSVMAECFMELNVADRRAAGPEPGTHNLNFHTPAERIVVSHRRYKKN